MTKYCLQVRQAFVEDLEEIATMKKISFICISAGCGTVEYEFTSEQTRDTMEALMKERVVSTVIAYEPGPESEEPDC